MKSQCIFIGLIVVLSGCNPSPTPSTSQAPASSPSPKASTPGEASPTSIPTPSASTATVFKSGQASPTSSPTASTQPSPPTSKAYTISTESIGPAKVGMKFGELKTLLKGKAELKVKSPFIVDFDAIAVTQSGQDQYYILYPAGVPLSDSDTIEALVTDNPNYRTAQGVGPGTSIKQAETVYGDATLSYNLLNESREYIKFAKQPSKTIAFRTKARPGQQFAGIYPSSTTQLKKTNEFQPTASIGWVEVICGKNCPPPSP